MGPLIVIAGFAALLAAVGGGVVVRGELRSVPQLEAGRGPFSTGGRPAVRPSLVLSTLQAMIALWTIGAVAGFLVFDLPGAADGPGVAKLVDVFRRATAAGFLCFIPFSLVTLLLAVRSLRQDDDDGKGVAPLIAAALYLVALLVLYSSPWFWKG